MMKVVAVCDKVGTALDRLCKGVAPYHTNLEYVVCDVHPKRPDPKQLESFVEAAYDADVIDFQYFRTAQTLLKLYPWLHDKKLILTHNNPYSIYEDSWAEFDMVVANNQTMLANLKTHTQREIEFVPLTVDANFWEFNPDWQPENAAIMVANRIESKKGILEAATAVGNLGMKFILVGAISDQAYYHEILQTGVVEFYEQIPDEKLRELYYRSRIHICNSKDDFESGTLPVLEAMLCGTPVLARNVGHVPDLYNGENITIHEGEPDDILGLMSKIEDMINDSKAMEAQRQSAWNTAKNFNNERRAYMYQQLYRKVLHPELKPVSIVVPICDKPEITRASLNAVARQDYPSIELIVCDDGDGWDEEIVKDFSGTVSFPVRYMYTGHQYDGRKDDYGLARSRNLGIIEATGEIIVFCDQRMVMADDAVSKLVANLVPKVWVYGNKNGKKDFVENFSAVFRQEIIRAGMFCERIDRYGGMSQEIRARTRYQGMRHVYVEDARAIPMGKSSNKNRKRADIIAMKNLLFKMELQ